MAGNVSSVTKHIMRKHLNHHEHIIFNNASISIVAWADNDLIAQAILFFIAGFETVSSAMTFTLHELAMNPDVQDKLVAEIRENNAKNGGKFDYNSIQNMTYMDMVVSGTIILFDNMLATIKTVFSES